MDESKYVVYFRNGHYSICKECYRNMLDGDEIIEDNLWCHEAAQLACNLNWNSIAEKQNLIKVEKYE